MMVLEDVGGSTCESRLPRCSLAKPGSISPTPPSRRRPETRAAVRGPNRRRCPIWTAYAISPGRATRRSNAPRPRGHPAGRTRSAASLQHDRHQNQVAQPLNGSPVWEIMSTAHAASASGFRGSPGGAFFLPAATRAAMAVALAALIQHWRDRKKNFKGTWPL